MDRLNLTAIPALLLTALLAGCGGTGSNGSGAYGSAAASSGGASSANSGGSVAASSAPAYGGGSSPAAQTTSAALITTKHGAAGTILSLGPKQMTVYLFEGDRGARSNCTGACAQVWPPVMGTPKAGGGAMTADLGTIARAGGRQVTYRGHPLYRYVKDQDHGDSYGQGIKSFGAEWYALRPSGQKAEGS
jgi:predicted lipoprotein with Yx(FWY)xxD motif